MLDVPGLGGHGAGVVLAADEEAAAVVGDVAAPEPAPRAHLPPQRRFGKIIKMLGILDCAVKMPLNIKHLLLSYKSK